jgi:hypothetical protein
MPRKTVKESDGMDSFERVDLVPRRGERAPTAEALVTQYKSWRLLWLKGAGATAAAARTRVGAGKGAEAYRENTLAHGAGAKATRRVLRAVASDWSASLKPFTLTKPQTLNPKTLNLNPKSQTSPETY